ncbi:pyrimidine reductase, riboflavin biosynthesis [Mycobacterium lentiflavum]|uniref:Pyrimidine reductase family protein n=1 Tax=Mycobacterium lentiflavum TaxID=141349 RepID=A0A0E4GY31_MYCLN|nr:pyrimidine reductase family protein [Mycobacterium lentiflavum]MEE3066067.1 pyrimidine reductase family protein [Actinomycetota bacterium]ULP44720.1 pyrimidine reductase family protein [Mycobacterium lentiflavum]CQD13778.1 pyrimidine reductase, riboflavin biosynthesis [Mycobacterium lentiflavum]
MTASDHHRKQADTVNDAPRVGTVSDIAELASFYAEPPDGVRVNMIYSADGAAAFGGRAGPLSSQTDQQLLKILRGFADVVLVGAATARAENYGPVQLSDAQQAERQRAGRSKPPPIAVISQTCRLPTRLVSDPSQPPLLVTCAESAARHNRSSDQPCGVLVAGEDTVDVACAIGLLRAHGLSRVLCEGGPTLLDELVDADVVVEVCVTLAPKLAASQPMGHRRQPSRLPLPAALRLEHALAHDDYLFLKYRR